MLMFLVRFHFFFFLGFLEGFIVSFSVFKTPFSIRFELPILFACGEIYCASWLFFETSYNFCFFIFQDGKIRHRDAYLLGKLGDTHFSFCQHHVEIDDDRHRKVLDRAGRRLADRGRDPGRGRRADARSPDAW